jgi:hypothetical protein
MNQVRILSWGAKSTVASTWWVADTLCPACKSRPVVHGDEAGVADGHAMGAAAEVAKHLLGATEVPLGVDDPAFSANPTRTRSPSRSRPTRQPPTACAHAEYTKNTSHLAGLQLPFSDAEFRLCHRAMVALGCWGGVVLGSSHLNYRKEGA